MNTNLQTTFYLRILHAIQGFKFGGRYFHALVNDVYITL